MHPKTATAYRLVTEYCSLQRIKVYLGKEGTYTSDNISKIFSEALSAIEKIGAEATEIIKENKPARKKRFLKEIKEYLADERLTNFQGCCFGILHQYNQSVSSEKKIDPFSDLTDFYKDGYYLAGQLIGTLQFELMICDDGETPPTETPSLPLIAVEEVENRIRVDLTAEQLTFLFKMLKDTRIVRDANQKEISKMLSRSFRLSKSSDDKSNSPRHIENAWSPIEAETAAFWTKKFTELSKKSEEYNPLKIKK